MKKITTYFLLSLIILLFINACTANNNETSNEDVFQYKGAFIGDNSAVTNITKQLKHSESLNEISLQTDTEPYGMTLTYQEFDASMIEKEYKETVIFNATFLFTLIENAEWVTFVFENGKYTITKEEVQSWYEEDLDAFTNEEDLKKLIQEQLDDENKVHQLLQ